MWCIYVCTCLHLQACGRLSVSRYVSDPDLWQGHKYDLRLYVLLISPTQVRGRSLGEEAFACSHLCAFHLLISFSPLQILLYNHLRIRVARKPYLRSISHLHDIHIHLTNTTLGGGGGEEERGGAGGCPTETLPMKDFLAAFPQRHPGYQWSTVQARIDTMLESCFNLFAAGPASLTATERKKEEEKEDDDVPYGRALLGVDVLLDAGLHPHLIEINASPNCIGIVQERPEFFNQVFRTAFIHDDDGVMKEEQNNGFRRL